MKEKEYSTALASKEPMDTVTTINNDCESPLSCSDSGDDDVSCW